jgi:enoyl-CoA hydratase/carnithine racemase
MTPKVIVRREDAVLRVVMNRPEKKNALDSEMYEAMIGALTQADADASLKAILIQGAGDAFTAGNDLDDFRRLPLNEDFPALRFVRALASCDTPIVAAVHGDAVGVGTTLVFHCDLAYTAPNTRFKMPFVDLGLVPEAASSLLVPERVGLAKASQYLLLCESFDAEEAWRLGVVNAVVPEGDLDGVALDAACRLAQKPADALKSARRLLRGDRASVLACIEEEGALFAKALASPSVRARLEAFFASRSGANR